MSSRDIVEYYNTEAPRGRDLVVALESSIVPAVGSQVSIRWLVWTVMAVSYAVDYADDPAQRRSRANVELCPCPTPPAPVNLEEQPDEN